MNAEKDPLPQDTTELLRRILNTVEPAKRKRGFEIACAVVLALATTASAWCAYQSKKWSGAQAARTNAAMRAGRAESVNSLAALQERAFDASMVIAFMQAKIEQNNRLETFLAQRFRPEIKPAMAAWLKLDPLNNPAAPPSPLQMEEYVQTEMTEASRQGEIAASAMAASREARRLSDQYVLLTVIFASVLFFGGIARAFDARALRTLLMALAVVLFLGTVVALITMPLCPE